MQETRERLRADGLRVTPQRLLVLQILEESGEYLDAKTIHSRGRARNLHLSLATVYRTLGTLREMGLVELSCLTRGDRQKYYRTAGNEEHYHFACLGCGRIVKVRLPRVEHVCREVARELGLTLTRVNVCLEGYCPDCAADLSSPADHDTPSAARCDTHMPTG
jgi:Fe2+ or Zn2+ uptake regulation protein